MSISDDIAIAGDKKPGARASACFYSYDSERCFIDFGDRVKLLLQVILQVCPGRLAGRAAGNRGGGFVFWWLIGEMPLAVFILVFIEIGGHIHRRQM